MKIWLPGGVGGGSDGDREGMLIYVGEGDGLTGMYGRPYFDNTMKTNYTVQVRCWFYTLNTFVYSE